MRILELSDGVYDREKYTEYLFRATESLFSPFGITRENLKDLISKREQTQLVV